VTIQRVRIFVGVVALGFVIALVLGSVGLLGGAKALGSSATLTLIGGSVSVRHGAGGTFVDGVDGEVLRPGDTVRTGAESRAVLTYFEGSTVTIEPGTELAIDAVSSQDSTTVVQMTQTIGRTWHVVTRLVNGNSKYEVKTPASTASVRGTAFTVETDGSSTTVTTTDGTVVDQVPDPQSPGRSVDVPVGPGQQHTQGRGQGPGAPQPAPPPDRKVTITLSEQNTIVIDTLGRANGIDKNGKVFRQTPGATLQVVDGRLVITLPNVPEGLLQVLGQGRDVDVQTLVEERGQSSTASERVSGSGRGSVDTSSKGKQPDRSASPTPTASPDATQASGGGTGGGQGQGQGTGQGNNPGQGGTNPGQGATNPGQGGPGSGQSGQQGGQGAPSARPTPGVVPSFQLPNLSPGPTRSPSSSQPGSGGTTGATGPGQSSGGAGQGGGQGAGSGGGGNTTGGNTTGGGAQGQGGRP
jgi:hypothetical protein